ncbi:alpha/beta hydrolase [Geodermatophilus sp. DSM 44513]|uniref:alpha/beta hydrolase n=1 Tax=Geodermatophilus sp. DSM 44513 TaxID=1528104 RepID=UPI00126C5930|nr:phospholipase [Geodermatophilus sp. DSM 44513]WNV74263.1 phospholipase [Geodermatophilus sp. DSM 44513]
MTRRAAAGRLTARPVAAPAAAPYAPGLHTVAPGPRARTRLLVPGGPPRPRPLLVFFHGAGGSPEQSLAAVGEPAGVRDVLVLAPASATATWDLLAGGLGPDVAALDAALESVLARQAVTSVAFGGFSDGASYALSLGLAHGELVDAVLALSPGFAAPPRLAGRPRVWISHGTDDRVLPVDRCGRRLARDLHASGHPVTYLEFDGGHVVRPEDVTAALTTWLGAPA